MYHKSAFRHNPHYLELKNLIDFDFCMKLEDCRVEAQPLNFPIKSNTERKIGKYLE
jgi:hypothetical protein